MTGKKFSPGRGYSKADWDAVSDNPELTDAELSQARPFAEALPDLAKAARRGRPKADSPKVLTTIRLDRDVLEAFKAQGPGWQSRINAALKKAI